MSVACPLEGAPIVEAPEEALPSKGIIWLVEPYADAIVNKMTEELQLGLVAGQEASDFQESDVQAGIVNCQACAHCASSFLVPKSITKLEDVIFHNLCQGR